MNRLIPGVGTYGQVGRFRPEQIHQRSNWDGIPESPAVQSTLSALALVKTQRHNMSTITEVNPLDPYYEEGSRPDWKDCPHDASCHCPKRTVRL